MGQQQILLIVLGVIIVGLAVFGSIKIYEYYRAQNALDRMVERAHLILDDAQVYYRKPLNLGGGGNSYTGWQPSDMITQEETTLDYTYTFGFWNFLAYVYIRGIEEDAEGNEIVVYAYAMSDNRRYVAYYNPETRRWSKLGGIGI